MNVYFLVEGKRSERKLYPAWLDSIAPHLRRVDRPTNITSNCYFLISGEGYPSILDIHLPNAIRDVEKIGLFDLLIIVLDAEENSVEKARDDVLRAVDRSDPKLKSAKLEVVIQNRCIETWLLANRKLFVRTPQDAELSDYINHYNVHSDDPETMPNYAGFNTHAQFHFSYLKAIFRERYLVYSKTNPGHAADSAYFEQLCRRTEECPGHISTFANFLNLCKKL